MSWLDPLYILRVKRLGSRAAAALGAGDYTQAEVLNKKALSIVHAKFGDDSLQTATYHTNLATIYAAQNLSKEAESHYRSALDITEKSLGKDHVDVTERIYDLADFLYSSAIQDRIDVAEFTEPLDELSDLLYFSAMDEAGSSSKTHSLADAEALYLRAHQIEQAAPS